MAPKTPKPKKAATKPKPATKSARASARASTADVTLTIPRATSGYDEDDVLLMGGGSRGAGFGRCGGRVLASHLEQVLCDQLSRVGVIHSHSPRHFEVRLEDERVGAYAPMIVLRGRGREGKTVVIEASDGLKNPVLEKIQAFRKQYGLEFYLIFVAPEGVLDEVSVSLYDESCPDTELGTLINRLAD